MLGMCSDKLVCLSGRRQTRHYRGGFGGERSLFLIMGQVISATEPSRRWIRKQFCVSKSHRIDLGTAPIGEQETIVE